ncbi:hypothetical protein SAMN05518855_1004238 [Paenibacillus sp. CF384]|nr:hypothetical protein SAMN05518855_1004238 [Paenibacillus sp. CF384]
MVDLMSSWTLACNYKWRHSAPSERALFHAKLAERIAYHYTENSGIYGSPKIIILLKQDGWSQEKGPLAVS